MGHEKSPRRRRQRTRTRSREHGAVREEEDGELILGEEAVREEEELAFESDGEN